MKKKLKNVAIWKIKESAAFLIQDEFVVDEAVDVSSSIPTNQMVQAFPHFLEFSFPAVEEKKVNLLLKCDLHQAYSFKEVLIGGARISIWIAHWFRWTFYSRDGGNQKLPRSPKLVVNFMTTAEHNAESCKQLLDFLEQDFRDCDESVGITMLLIKDK